ncbi:hypothetical protein DXG01_015442 [Tephrocybe rancida]|nr:hypothetical protein DXG01_015442 [Tephrocybe rancida]
MDKIAQEAEEDTLMKDFDDSDLQAPQESQPDSYNAQVQSFEDTGAKEGTSVM